MTTGAKRRVLLALVLTAAALVAGGCGGAPPSPAQNIASLRERAKAEPKNADLQRTLAVLEALGTGGDPKHAQERLTAAIRLRPADLRLRFLAASLARAHGDLTTALEHYLATLRTCATSTDRLAPAIAELSLAAAIDLRDEVPSFRRQAEPLLDQLWRAPGRIGVGAWQRIGDYRIDHGLRRGELAFSRRSAIEQGCVTSWKVAGPFGPRELLGFDKVYSAETDEPLKEQYDLGAGRGVQRIRDRETRGCAVHLGGGPVSLGGTSIARATFVAPTAGVYALRLESPNNLSMRIDGHVVATIDRRTSIVPRTHYFSLPLAAGRHTLSVKLTTRHPNPVLIVAFSSLVRGGSKASIASGTSQNSERTAYLPVDAARDPSVAARASAQDGDAWLEVYVSAAHHALRGDAVSARESLRAVVDKAPSSPLLLSLAGQLAFADPLLPADQRKDKARQYFRRAAGRDTQAWEPQLQLSTLDSMDGRTLEAAARLRRASQKWPYVSSIPLALSDVLMQRNFTAEAKVAVARARRTAPEACAPIRAALRAAQAENRTSVFANLSREHVRCDARSDALLTLALQQRNWSLARKEITRLSSFEPKFAHSRLLTVALEVARATRDTVSEKRVLTALAELEPQSDEVIAAAADLAASEGRGNDGLVAIDRAITAHPSAMAELHRLRPLLGGENLLDTFRLDGDRLIREFESSGRTYPGPQVLVLDYTVVQIFNDGSSMDLTHNIIRLQSQEAVEEHGEFRVPEGARLLKVHTIKPDGRRLEPDVISGKDTLSLPNLAPGDYVEFEYVRPGTPPAGFPGGYLGDRFFFQSFEVPFDRSELTVIAPKHLALQIDRRGNPPSLEKTVRGDQVVYRFQARRTEPRVVEPMSVAASEFLPSINVGFSADWPAFIESLRDILADQNPFDPEAARLLRTVTGQDHPSPLARAKRIYAWVLENIDESEDAFGAAPLMIAARSGNRARVLHYLLRLAGLDAELALARSRSADHTASKLPNAESFRHLVIRLRADDGSKRPARAHWLFTAQKGAPFGYVPPLLRGEPALVLGRRFERAKIPFGEEGADRRQVQVEVSLKTDGSASIEVTETFLGVGAVSWRDQLEQVPRAELNRRFEEQYVTRIVPGARLRSLVIKGVSNRESPLTLNYTFDAPDLARKSGNMLIVEGVLPTRLSPAYARVASRTTTELVDPPVILDTTVRIRAASGLRFVRGPSSVHLSNRLRQRFAQRFAKDGTTFVTSRSIRLPDGRVDAKDYAELSSFCRRVDDAEVQPLIFEIVNRRK